jgi:hypothetical protein
MNKLDYVSYLNKNKDYFHYAIVEDYRSTIPQGSFYTGRLVGKNFLRDIAYTTFPPEAITEIREILRGSICNFVLNQKNPDNSRKFINHYRNVVGSDPYRIISLQGLIELNFFDLLSLMLDYEGLLLVDSGELVSLNRLQFGMDKLSIYVSYLGETGGWHSKKLFSYGRQFDKEDFSVFVRSDSRRHFEQYIASGAVIASDAEWGGKEYLRLDVNSDNLFSVPLKFESFSKTFSKQFLLTVIYELSAYKAYIEGINLTERVAKHYFGYPKQEYTGSYEKSGESVLRNFSLRVPRKRYDLAYLVKDLTSKFELGERYLYNKDEEAKKQYKTLLQSKLIGPLKDLAVEGALEMFSNLSDDFVDVQKMASKIRAKYESKIVYHLLYYTYWRSIFIMYPHLIKDYFLLPDMSFTVSGGVYEQEYSIVF